jgi:hypothetical protein
MIEKTERTEWAWRTLSLSVLSVLSVLIFSVFSVFSVLYSTHARGHSRYRRPP